VGLALPVVWSDRHRLHDPAAEVWVGVRTPGTELPERAERIREALEAEGARFVEAEPQPDDAVTSVHDPELVAHLAGAWDEWRAAGLDDEPGADSVVPYLFPHPALFNGTTPRTATLIAARAGQFAYDTMTLVGPGTWDAARGALDAAVTAAELVLGGERAAYALCRPPGHHVTRSCFGGSCYLNNSAAAAARLAADTDGTVAVLDIDAHHGNGAQAIFWDEPRVITGSVHVDPGAGWFPHFLGFTGETGPDGGNRNVTLAPGTDDEAWVEAVGSLATWARERGAEALVVPLGVDAAEGDSQAPLAVTGAGFRAAGRALGALGLPTVLVQEGGYDLTAIGALVIATLQGIEEGLDG
jgi:acetoin utilization deacetylase AcuC-like enzyme